MGWDGGMREGSPEYEQVFNYHEYHLIYIYICIYIF
jgi:hypothetical protein